MLQGVLPSTAVRVGSWLASYLFNIFTRIQTARIKDVVACCFTSAIALDQ